jgi:putative ABC transport system permease protein
MKYIPLVWAAVMRKPAEAILVCLAVTAAFTLFGLILGLRATYQGLVESTRMDRLEVDPRFPTANGLRLPLAMRDQIARMDGVSAVGAYYILRGQYQDPHNTFRIRLVDEGMRYAWSELPLSPRQWDRLFSTPTGVLVSRNAAQQWNLKEGDVLPITAPSETRADGSKAWEFHVLAIVDDIPTRTGGFVLGNYKYFDQSRPLQDQGNPMAFRVAILDPARANEISLQIDRLFANSGTPTTTIPEKSNEQFAVDSGISAASVIWPVAGAGLFMILLLTANAIAQSVRERIPEFAVLKTLGFQDGTLSSLVFLEAAIPCLLGGVLGTALAAALTQWPVSYLPRDLTDLPKPNMSPAVLVSAMACVVVLALVSSAIPVLRLRRLSVIDALAGR